MRLRPVPYSGAKARAALLAGAFAVALAAPGCSPLREATGLEKQPPDEFRVLVRAPLSMPQDYGLRAPRPGSDAAQEKQLRDRTRQIVLEAAGKGEAGTPAPERIEGVTEAEAALLRRAGADEVDPSIRQVVNRESEMLARSKESFVYNILFWKTPEKPGVVVDPEGERRRIQENAALGRPLDAGEIPTITRKDRRERNEGLFDWLFK